MQHDMLQESDDTSVPLTPSRAVAEVDSEPTIEVAVAAAAMLLTLGEVVMVAACESTTLTLLTSTEVLHQRNGNDSDKPGRMSSNNVTTPDAAVTAETQVVEVNLPPVSRAMRETLAPHK
ncbi:hypothetical protein MHU86_23961 [Fragilaria crotonensis]|nr:hypothetical protein MHU86_23961 [Fragilaria crotonensis]